VKKKKKLKDNIYQERKTKLFWKAGNIKLSSQSFQHLHWLTGQWDEIDNSVWPCPSRSVFDIAVAIMVVI
jgi:hypothetical protein